MVGTSAILLYFKPSSIPFLEVNIPPTMAVIPIPKHMIIKASFKIPESNLIYSTLFIFVLYSSTKLR
jgi:hypothetical protein